MQEELKSIMMSQHIKVVSAGIRYQVIVQLRRQLWSVFESIQKWLVLSTALAFCSLRKVHPLIAVCKLAVEKNSDFVYAQWSEVC